MSDAAPPSQPAVSTPPAGGYAGTAVVTGIVGIVFLMLGWAFGQWLTTRSGNPYAIEWTTGPLAGQLVAYFDLTGGTAWRDMGQFATGVLLIVEAVLYGVLMMQPKLFRSIIPAVLVLAVAGCALNALSAAMQIRAGFTQPLFALIGLAVCAVSAMSAWQRLRPAQ